MCGRFTLSTDIKSVAAKFGVPPTLQASPRYNVAPTQEVVSILSNGSAHMEWLQWGLIPSWAKDESIGSKMINARAETLAETCTIVTTQPNALVTSIHDRMPVILSSDGCDMWLDSELRDEQALLPLLAPYPAEEMTARAVSRLVNNPKSEGAELIA